MWRYVLVLAACGSTTAEQPTEPPTPTHKNACVGLWKLAETRIVKTTCSGLGKLDEEIIVDVDAGRYRARRSSGGFFEVKSQSSLDAPCALVLFENGYKAAIDTSYALEWR